MISVNNIYHEFDGRTVLNNVSFEVEKGDIVAVMGSSGGGKTTLLKIMGALLKPTKGDVLLDELSVVNNPVEAHKRVGLVFQYSALFDYLSVRENILFGIMRKSRLNRANQSALVEKMLDLVSLDLEVATKMPNELSGGMRKRVGLARALALAPELLLFDEPTSGLDPITAYSIDELIVDTRNKLGITSVVVSHDVNSVLRVADKIAFLETGELKFFGTPQEFMDNTYSEIAELIQKSTSRRLQEIQ